MSADMEWREFAQQLVRNGHIDAAGAAELSRLHRKACRQEAAVRRLLAARTEAHLRPALHSFDAMRWTPQEDDHEAAHPVHP